MVSTLHYKHKYIQEYEREHADTTSPLHSQTKIEHIWGGVPLAPKASMWLLVDAILYLDTLKVCLLGLRRDENRYNKVENHKICCFFVYITVNVQNT